MAPPFGMSGAARTAMAWYVKALMSIACVNTARGVAQYLPISSQLLSAKAIECTTKSMVPKSSFSLANTASRSASLPASMGMSHGFSTPSSCSALRQRRSIFSPGRCVNAHCAPAFRRLSVMYVA